MDLLDPVPVAVQEVLDARTRSGEAAHIALAGDMGPHGQFAPTWLVATRERVLVIPPSEDDRPGGEIETDDWGTSSPGPLDRPWFPPEVQELKMAHVEEVKTEAVVGCWRLVVKLGDATRPVLYYTGAEAARFAEAAAALTQLAKEGRFVPSAVEDDTRCSQCGQPLPERGSNCPKCVDKRVVLRRIIGYLKPYRRQVVRLAALALVTGGLAIIPPLLVRALVDGAMLAEGVSESDRIATLVEIVGLMVLVRVLSTVAELVHRIIAPRLAYRTTFDIRRELFERLEFLSLAFYDRRQVGAIMSRLTNDSATLQEFLCEGAPFLVNNTVMFVGILIVLFVMHPLLALFVLIPAPIIVLAGFLASRHLRQLFHQWWVRFSGFSAFVNEALTGIRVTKAFAREGQQLKGFEAENRALANMGIRVDTTWGVIYPLLGFLFMSGTIVVWGVGGWLVIRGELSTGAVYAFIYYLFLFYMPLQWFTQAYQWMNRALTGAERIFDVIDMKPETAIGAGTPLPRPLEGRVSYRAVTFGYDKSKPVLHDISLEVEPGEMIGLVGKSGAGKSTLVKLLCRFYIPDHGRVAVDGQDLADADVATLREQIGMVPQESFLFDGTIAANISFGRPDCSLEEIIAAARAANAHEFICQKPDGYDTRVGEGGKLLSTGEKQRVSIARAVLRDPRILILDEATSSVDSETEQQIQEALARLVKGRTTFAIAHRLSTLRNADRLIVLDEGRVKEIGTHDELLKDAEGTFSKLVKMQRDISKIVEVGL